MGTPQGLNDARKACYQLFKKDDPTGHSDFLRVWNETEALAEGDKTAFQRGRVFRKHVAEGRKLVSISFVA